MTSGNLRLLTKCYKLAFGGFRAFIQQLLLARLMDQYCLARCLSSVVVVFKAAGVRAYRPPGAWVVGRSTLHDGPVRLRPVRETPYFV